MSAPRPEDNSVVGFCAMCGSKRRLAPAWRKLCAKCSSEIEPSYAAIEGRHYAVGSDEFQPCAWCGGRGAAHLTTCSAPDIETNYSKLNQGGM